MSNWTYKEEQSFTNEEDIKKMTEIDYLKQENISLKNELDALRLEFKIPLQERVRREDMNSLLKIIVNNLNEKYNTTYPSYPSDMGQKQRLTSTKFVLDDLTDTAYASSEADFRDVLHIFHAEWFGIRAAAGSLPGRKIAITSEDSFNENDLYEIKSLIISLNPSKIIFHAMSSNMAAVIYTVSREFESKYLYFVHHGAPSQWFHEPDRKAAFIALEMLDKGILHKVHIMRSGFEYSHKGVFTPLLLNKAPKIDAGNSFSQIISQQCKVFIPGWSGWRKNIYINAYAAALCEDVDAVLAYGHDIILPGELSRKLQYVTFIDRVQTMQLMSSARITMNASLVDCHPMANIESQVLGIPCIQGNLFLDALQDHEYCKFSQVADVNSVTEIRNKIKLCLSESKTYISDLTKDYQRQLDDVSLARYREFLEL